ncbi:hypothetical protein [Ornithinibacillus scapharcae]|uniref:hypothetical protein n=1 Tax=Ornithinibacillus scapharcae TaxID=1147159 RepID=UPI000225AB42|nr:hypothetical protein [Ornithinibacillus scapharcae]
MENQNEITIKKLVDQYLQEQVQQLLKAEPKMENNASFIFLDNQTINLLLLYLFIKGDNQPQTITSDIQNDSPDFEQLKQDNKNAFEEIIQMLKDKLNKSE